MAPPRATTNWTRQRQAQSNQRRPDIPRKSKAIMDELLAAEAAIRGAVPSVVQRHRSAGVLTRALLHRMEAEVFADVVRAGGHSRRILDSVSGPLSHR